MREVGVGGRKGRQGCLLKGAVTPLASILTLQTGGAR